MGQPTADDALEAAMQQLGPFGFYQGYMLVMLCIPNLLACMFSLNYVFVADQVPFRCAVPECEGGAPAFQHAPAWALLPNTSACRRLQPLQPDLHSCDPQHYHPNLTIQCDAFVYENHNTIFAEFDLGCREWLRTMVGTVRNIALPFALLLTGYVSDTFGRRAAFCVFAGCAGVLGVLKACAPDYRVYLALEFLEAALGYGFNSAGYVLLVEWAHPSVRAAFACATGVAYGAGGVLFAGLAWRLRYWRHLLWVAHSLALLLPAYRLLLDESPRWLHARGRHRCAARVLRKAATWNKIQVNEELMSNLLAEADAPQTDDAATQSVWRALVRSRVLMWRFAMCCWCWAATTFVYYGLTINSVLLSGNKHINFALNMSMEIAASLLIMMALERIGRRMCIFLAFVLCGVACVSPFFVSHGGTSLGLYFLGKLSITFAFNALYVFTAELYPTRVRSSALAACSLLGRVGSVLAPQTPLLSPSLQAALYGACSAAAALAVLAAPETRGARLPQRVADAEHIRAPPSTLDVTPAQAPTRVLSADT